MITSALQNLYRQSKLRGLEVYRQTYLQAADESDEGDALMTKINGTLRAATDLMLELNSMKKDVASTYTPRWHVEVLYTLGIAHVCSNQIVQLIGGPDAHNLPDFSVRQLLDLLLWIEFFRETIEEEFPSIAPLNAKKMSFDERPTVQDATNIEDVMDCLCWEKNMLWEIHSLVQDELLVQLRDQTDAWILKVYKSTHQTNQTSEGHLVTSLCEDLFSLAGVQLRTICVRLSRKSATLVIVVCIIFSRLRACQLSDRDKILNDLETCCAAANGFKRMGDRVEDLAQEVIDQSDLPERSSLMLEDSCEALVSIYCNDSVYAAQMTHHFIFQSISRAIATQLFETKWEIDLTHNELVMILTRTLDDFMSDLEVFLDDFLLKKAIDALIAATVLFYVKCLLRRAKKDKMPYFVNTGVALDRIHGDVKIMREYFDDIAQTIPSLSKVIEEEFSVLLTIQELLRIASLGLTGNDSTCCDFITVLYKRIKDFNVTKHVVKDLWYLVQPKDIKKVKALINDMREPLGSMYPTGLDKRQRGEDRNSVPGLQFDKTIAQFYQERNRRTPANAAKDLVSKFIKLKIG